MRRLATVALLGVLVAGACGGGGPAAGPTTTLPGDLVPASASDAQVTVAANGTTSTVPPATVHAVLPLLVRRVFDASEPLASYGLDHPRATVTFTAADGSSTVLHVGADDFDHSAAYVQRDGDPRVWLVLTTSLQPLIG